MKDKNVFSKLTLQTQRKYKNTKIQICLQGLLPRGIGILKNISRLM